MAAPTSLPARITPADTTAAAAQTYYVDPSIGSDSNTATQAKSTSTPWATVQHALDSGIPIPTSGSNTPVQLYIRGTDGTTTRGFTITDTGPGSAAPTGFTAAAVYQPARALSFPSDSPLLISNYPGERVLIGFPVLHPYSHSYLCWRASDVNGKKGIVFDSRFPAGNTTFTGWATHGGTNLELYNCEVRNNVWNASGGGVYVGAWSFSGVDQSANNVQIINCYIHHNGGQNVGSHGIYYGGTTGTELTGAIGGAVYNCLIVFNYADNLCPHNMASGSVFAHNICSGWGGGGVSGSTATTPVTGDSHFQSFTDGITFFAAPGGGDPQSTNNVVVNNILAFNHAYGLNQFDSSSGGGNVEKNNLYFGNGSGARRDASSTWTLSSTLTNNDPQFASFSPTDPASNFTPAATSPVVAAASAAFVPTFDFNGTARTTSDIGPFQVSGSGGTVTIHNLRSMLGVGN